MGTLTNLCTQVSFYNQDKKGRDPHLSNTFVNPCLRRQFRQLLGCQLLHANFALLNGDLCLGNIDLLLRCNGAGFNLLQELWAVRSLAGV